MMKATLALLCLTVAVQGFNTPWAAWKEEEADKKCIAYVDAVVEGIVLRGDYSTMNTMVDEANFVAYVLPATLGSPREGYNVTGYQGMNNRLVAFDPFTAFEIVKEKRYISTSGCGPAATYNCVVLGYSVAVTETGRHYSQNYSFTLEMDSSMKVTTYYEQADSLYSFCFFGFLPRAVCAALGL